MLLTDRVISIWVGGGGAGFHLEPVLASESFSIQLLSIPFGTGDKPIHHFRSGDIYWTFRWEVSKHLGT